jgi:HEAT repeat protein
MVWLAVAAAALGGVVWLWPRQPSYHEKSLSAWLADLDLENPHPSEEAQRAVRTIGTNSLPYLVKMLSCEEPFWERTVNVLERHQSLVHFQITPAGAIRYRAVLGFGTIGSGARDGVPALVQLLNSNRSAQVRAAAASALGAIGPAAEAAIPALTRATQDPDAQVRRSALLALVNIQRSADRGARGF